MYGLWKEGKPGLCSPGEGLFYEQHCHSSYSGVTQWDEGDLAWSSHVSRHVVSEDLVGFFQTIPAVGEISLRIIGVAPEAKAYLASLKIG